MHTAKATLKSVAPYSQSRAYEREVPKNPKEKPDDYEKRTWRERLHVNEDGFVFIPPMAFKNGIAEIAKYLSEQIPGKGKATYTKHFEAGVLVLEPLVLPIKKEDVSGQWLHVPANGQRGSGKRVWKCFPLIQEWQGDVTFHVLDDTITEDVFQRHLEQFGQFIGIGTFRPRNNGYFGRFEVTDLQWD